VSDKDYNVASYEMGVEGKKRNHLQISGTSEAEKFNFD
jgi:hypothetical protein